MLGWLPEWLFSRFRWYRRRRGGHWERWWVDMVYSDIWHPVPECSLITGERPTSLCRGTPACEDYR